MMSGWPDHRNYQDGHGRDAFDAIPQPQQDEVMDPKRNEEFQSRRREALDAKIIDMDEVAAELNASNTGDGFAGYLGKRLRNICNDRKMPIKKVAVMTGISQQTISMYLRGQRMPPLPKFARLCRVLDVSADDLLFGDPQESPQ